MRIIGASDEEGDQPIPTGGIGALLEQALTGQGDIGLVVLDADLRVQRTLIDPDRFRGLVIPPGTPMSGLVPEDDAADFSARMRQVLDSGVPLLFHTQRMTNVVVTLFALRVEGDNGSGNGLLLSLIDVTDEHRASQRLDLMFSAADAIGESLDVATTAGQLTDTLVPRMADFSVVNLAKEVFDGDEPPQRGGPDIGLRRAAVTSAGMIFPPPFVQLGEDLPPVGHLALLEQYRRGQMMAFPNREALFEGLNRQPELMSSLAPPEGHQLLAIALVARGLVLGSLEVWRREGADPFDASDERVLQEIASRGALSIDNARRYTREHAAVLTLQRSLLPAASLSAAADTVGWYIPAASGGGPGGDWYDVIPLSSGRVALVVGDVVGHGLTAAATMARMRTAVQTLADMDLTPDELLTHLDDLVLRLAAGAEPSALCSTCLYVVYDPVARSCCIASAGHPPPALVSPDGTAAFVELDPGPPLGIGGLPFEAVTINDLAPGTVIALYTDGLVEAHGDISAGMDTLRYQLTGMRPSDSLEGTAASVLAEVTAVQDDATMLLARLHAVDPADTAEWEIPPEEAAVATARQAANDRLTKWGAPDDILFTTELIVSEIVTNAIRYSAGPSRLRLTRFDELLVCEVSDSSSTAPHLRRARAEDEGGRGLLIVAQLATRWGVRFHVHGKVIWCELDWPSRGRTDSEAPPRRTVGNRPKESPGPSRGTL